MRISELAGWPIRLLTSVAFFLVIVSGNAWLVANDVLEFPSHGKNEVIKRFPVKASQGVAVDARYFYAISNTQITKFDKETGNVVATWQADKEKPEYRHFKHINSGTVIEGKLYGAHSRYGIDPNDNTVEIWDVTEGNLKHEQTIPMLRKYGSLTWIDRSKDGAWWMCFAVYGKGKNQDTTLVQYDYKDKKFIEVDHWNFPEKVIPNWGTMSCSGGSWGPDGYLYTTGHDHAKAFVLEIDKSNHLKYVRTEDQVGFSGQAIAWDRSSEEPVLWGIVRNKNISLTKIPSAKTLSHDKTRRP